MCLILFAYQIQPDYPLIVAANRDEFYSRPTQQAHWWSGCSEILAGKDQDAGGTWLGVSRTGKFAAITNVREPHLALAHARSRGLLPLDYLAWKQSDRLFAQKLERSRNDYRGYNLLYGNPSQLYHYSNRTQKAECLRPGIYGLSNANLDTPWPKVVEGKNMLRQELGRQQPSADRLFEILSTSTSFPDAQLPQTGVSLEWERLLSAICISGAEYGTRSSTILLFDRQGTVQFHEKSIAPQPHAEFKAKFQIENEKGRLRTAAHLKPTGL